MTKLTSEPAIAALLIGRDATDRLLLQEMFRQTGWRLFQAGEERHVMAHLSRNPVHVVLMSADTPGWDWRKVLAETRRIKPSPLLVVTSRNADDYLWAEVLNMGGFDVLAQPFDRSEVERVLASARRHYNPIPERAGKRASSAVA